MGNDNPIRNSKLLREAYEAGRRQALNETSMGGGPSMQQAPSMNSMGTPVPPQNRMGMGSKGKIQPGPGTFPGGVYDDGKGNLVTPVPLLPSMIPFPPGGYYDWTPSGWVIRDAKDILRWYYAVPGGWRPISS